MPDDALTRTVECRRFRGGRFADFTDEVATEIRVSLDVAGVGRKTLFAAPIDPEGLALGHAALDMLWPDRVPVLVRSEGLAFALDARPDVRPVVGPDTPPPMAAGHVLACMRRFISAPGLWDGTGCFHRAGLYDAADDAFVARAEDIGRHNCLDRLAGWGVRQERRLDGLILFLSCRVTASMMAKALRVGSRLVVSRSAVTGAALDAAREAGVTLVGFARDAEDRFTAFCDPAGRIGS